MQGKVQDKKWSSLCRAVNRIVTSKYNTPQSTYGAWTLERKKRSTLKGLRLGLKQTSSFVRLWEILMWYISLKFQYKNYFLNLWKRNARMMRAAEQGPKQESIRDWNIYWNLRLLCKIQRAQKKRKTKNQWALEKCYSFATVGLEKNSGALRWLIRQNLRLSRKCVTWKAILFGPEGMIGKGALGNWRVFPGTTSWRVLRQNKVGLVNSAAT